MGDQAKLEGPDLTQGVDARALKSGDKVLGHAHGEPVLLARVDDEFFAIGGTCTHYGGPLAEGVIDGETVRCPWHHACFSLRSGEALRAPALNPVACWNVERRDGTVVVTNKVERDPLSPTFAASFVRGFPHAFGARLDSADGVGGALPQHVVIVGAGAAGTAAGEMLRRCGFDGRITIIDEDTGSPYDRPNLSKDYLAGNAPEDWIPIRPRGFYAQHKIDCVHGRVTRVDVASKRLNVDGQGDVSYDALLLATGAEPVRLDTPGADLPHVHYLRSLKDSRSIIDAAKHAKRAVVVGASFIGLEVAASLRARNVEVHVVAPDTLPLERVLGDYLGRFVQALHTEKGVVFHLGHTVQRVGRDAVVLDDQSRLDADLVVFGVGVRPRLQLAEQAGLDVDHGVTVNEFLETSAPGVFAAGDIARWPDPHTGDAIRVEHWVVAERQGQTAARNILGARERFDQVPFFWSAHYDVSFNYIGHAQHWDRVEVDGDAAKHDVAVRYVKGDKVVALATLFRDEESLKTELEWEGRAPPSERGR